MRAPDDLPRRQRQPGSGRRRRAFLIVAVIVLLVLLTSLRGIAGFYTDYLWFDSLDQGGVWRGVLACPGRAGRGVHGPVLRAGLGQPLRRRPHRAALPGRRPRGRAARALPRRGRRAGGPGAHRGGGPAGDHRRLRRVRRVERLGAVLQRRVVRRRRPPVRPRRRLLRLQAAVPVVRGRLAVRLAADRADRHGGRPLPQRRHPGAAARAPGRAPGQGPPVGARGAARAGQGASTTGCSASS